MAQIKILFENKGIIAIDKPAGISVQTSHRRQLSSELLKALLNHKADLSDLHLVHRLDKHTSGVLIIAKSISAKKILQRQFKDRDVRKTYLALVNGVPKQEAAQIDLPIGRHPKDPRKRAVKSNGKKALTTYRIKKIVMSRDNPLRQYSLLEVQPKTGRTHQIRVHLSYLGYPIVGDSLYGPKTQVLNRLWLHAQKLTINLPHGGQKNFSSPLPSELNEFLKRL